MFGAEELWTRGHTGAKVKMAIFDTGIRADHPHFRNIKVNGCFVSLMLRVGVD
ncbi:membrane-bound transcription factor site-1 protease-like [Trifolium medium]|uniref:Membrane-bound transcription factor site-1 protease-like n=1 Tax=Trifolium medium TaxID=97028 RepID=A0A392VAA5_9FABA|nr:membrane-bound transcription factor site-1 protease-like [Trifolium medium]